MTHDSLILDIEEHPFAQYVRILGKGKKGSRSLTEEEAFTAMSMILNGEAEDLQIGAFLMLLRVKEESAEELSGFVKAVKAKAKPPFQINVDLDWSSYAGKRRHQPWFVFSILLLAQAGYRILIHGASGHTTNRMYTETIMSHLNMPVADSWQSCNTHLDTQGFCYLPLGIVSPKLAEMIDMRSILGLRSPVHSLSRLINPCDAPCVLQGIFHPPYSHLHQQAAQLLDYQNLAVIKGEGGEIERNPDNALTVFHCRSGKLSQEEWPALFPRRHVKAKELSAEHMVSIWKGETADEYAEGAILSTCALALKQLDHELSQASAIEKATQLWTNRNLSQLG